MNNSDKGVIVKIEEPENMPVDASGNRADIVMDPYSTISRMNVGRLYETYISAASRDVGMALARLFMITDTSHRNVADVVQNTVENDPNTYKFAWDYLMSFYSATNKQQSDYFNTQLSEEEKIEHLVSCISECVFLYMPPDNDPETMDIVDELECKHKPTYGPVSYVGESGVRCTTHENVRIAPMYMLLLEKIGDAWASVSSGKLQHFGILSPMTKREKYAYPFRNSPVRTISETEGRLYVSYCGREAAAEMMDRNNSPTTHKAVVKSILEADYPSNIDHAIDRNAVPFGLSKPLQVANGVLLCGGIRTVYEPETEHPVPYTLSKPGAVKF